MKNKKILIKRLAAGILAILLTVTQNPVPLWATEKTTEDNSKKSELTEEETEGDKSEDDREIIKIDSIETFRAFEENCKEGKNTDNLDVQLNADLDLSEYSEFGGFQSFAGHFHGNGHEISGFNSAAGDASVGFFRYVEGTALIEDLHITVMIISDDSSNYVGGLAGVNAGIIRNCTVDGVITGTGVTGGIAGLNGGNGTLESCVNQSYITSSQSVGGITGENRGIITACENQGEINADSQWLSLEDDAVISFSVEGLLSYLTSNLETGRDIGGIAGWSNGVITESTNKGIVGYQHAGRNVGGIVGRFCGQITDCTNAGKVYGKQDVGGIAGQFEPTILEQEGESISAAAENIKALQDKLVSDVNTAEKNIQTGLKNVTDTVKSKTGNQSGEKDSDADTTVEEQQNDTKEETSRLQDEAERLKNDVDVSKLQDKIENTSTQLEEYDDLYDSLSDVSDAVSKAQDTINANADQVLSDINAINNQITDLNNLAEDRKDNLKRIEDGGDLIEDYSAISPDNENASRINGCTNTGYVNGDRNVGGIAGALAIEGSDSEDTNTDTSSDLYMTLAVLENCKNSGIIIVKKENGGGIVGNGDLGLIRLSTDTGRIVGDDANFLGGIAGNDKGTIADCNAISVINGARYIGGIAGQAKRVRNCYSMSVITEAEGWLGAVVGNVTSESREEDYSVVHSSMMNSVYQNYYVSDSLYGINGISYEGVAEAISYEQLTGVEGIAKEFSSLTITFLDENYDVIKKTKVKFGEELSDISYPYTETEEGEYVQWSGFYSKSVAGNVFLLASTEDENTTLASKTADAGKSLAYVSGSFTELSEFTIEDVTEQYFPEQEDNVTEHVYAVTLDNTSMTEDTVTKLRILKEQENGDAAVYIRDGEQWKATDYREIGSYIEVSIKGTKAVVRVQITEQNNYTRLWLYAAVGVVFVLLVFGIWQKKRVRKYTKKHHSHS